MYVRLVRFAFGSGKHAAAQALAAELAPLIAEQPGCQQVTIFGRESDGEYGIYVLWDSAEHAEEAALVVRPQLGEHLAGNALGPPEAGLFDVLAP